MLAATIRTTTKATTRQWIVNTTTTCYYSSLRRRTTTQHSTCNLSQRRRVLFSQRSSLLNTKHTIRNTLYFSLGTAALLLLPATCRHYYTFGRNQDENDNEMSNNNNSKTPIIMLCHSPVICNDNDSSLSWYQRLIQWLKHFFINSHHIILLTLRGSEIIIRFLPLLILTPASIIAANFINNSKNMNNDKMNQVLQSFLNKENKKKTISEDDDDDDDDHEYTLIRRMKTKVKMKRYESINKVKNNKNNNITNLDSYNDDYYDYDRYYGMKTNNWISDMTWNYVIDSITTLGPVFIKLCQWIATRRDLFPPHICNRLSQLHDHSICHDWYYTNQTLIDSFGIDYYKELLIEHDTKNKNYGVIGCGSAAQVYKGILLQKKKKDDIDIIERIPVAIKVLHPNFEQLIQRDLLLLQTLTGMIHSIPIEMIRLLNLPRVTNNFGNLLMLQSDLRYEANNLLKFRNNFYGTTGSNNIDGGADEESSIFFPKPISSWISKNVLVEQLVENSVPISDYLLHDNNNDTNNHHPFLNEYDYNSGRTISTIRKELAIPLLNAFLKMVFLDNFVHCDLHPGNVLVREYYVQKETSKTPFRNFNRLFGNKMPAAAEIMTRNNDSVIDLQNIEMKRQIVFLDAGIAFQLDRNDQQNLIDLFRAVVTNNGKEAGKLMVERAKYERCSTMPNGVEEFSMGIHHIVADFHDRRKDGLTLGAVRIGSLLTRVLDLCRVYGVEIDPAMANVIISTLVLEGLGRSLEPSLNLIDFALPFILGRGKI